MTKHTLGPWYTEGHEIKVVQPHREFLGEGAPETICEMLSSVSPEATEANARLIAAAPDLLAALLSIHDDLEPDDEGNRVIPAGFLDSARAAIAKATK